MKSSASLDWLPVVQDLFLEHAPPARIAAWLDGTVSTHVGYLVVRGMRAIDGFDATILVRLGQATSLSIWYRDLERPALAAAEAILGPATERRGHLFELVFTDATRPIDDKQRLVVACSADASPERRLVGLALGVVE
ncbi:MAG: hypothetical protein M4D80_23425 [Myxococcota bacterium]|nr:hypothetical protein [Myxococcota bacterium]